MRPRNAQKSAVFCAVSIFELDTLPHWRLQFIHQTLKGSISAEKQDSVKNTSVSIPASDIWRATISKKCYQFWSNVITEPMSLGGDTFRLFHQCLNRYHWTSRIWFEQIFPGLVRCIRFLLVPSVWKDRWKRFISRCKIISLPDFRFCLAQQARMCKSRICVGILIWIIFPFDFCIKIRPSKISRNC